MDDISDNDIIYWREWLHDHVTKYLPDVRVHLSAEKRQTSLVKPYMLTIYSAMVTWGTYEQHTIHIVDASARNAVWIAAKSVQVWVEDVQKES